MLKGFKDFIMKGNLVELAVAFIMATAFAAVVTAFTAWLMSYIPAGDLSFDETPFGQFMTALVTFLVVAAVVYFAVVVPYERVKERMTAQNEEAAVTPDDVLLLQEIRDLLRTQGGAPTGGSHSGGPTV